MAGGIPGALGNLLAPPDGEVRDIPGLQQTLREWIAANRARSTRSSSWWALATTTPSSPNSAIPPAMNSTPSPRRSRLSSSTSPVISVPPTRSPRDRRHQRRDSESRRRRHPEARGRSGAEWRARGNRPLRPALENARSNRGRRSRDLYQGRSELWARFGFTTAQEGRSSPGAVAAMKKAADEGRLKIDVVTYPAFSWTGN